MSASSYYHAENCTVKARSAQALLIEFDDEDIGEQWVPLSLIADEEQYEKGDSGLTISIADWKAKALGFDTGE